jgi:glycosyltransferase involved in cell wall biosynthesis
METAKILLDRGHDVRVWAHTDVLERYWSIGNLIADYGLLGRVAVTQQRFTDEQMAKMYSACDITLGIAPEGFGFAEAESLACGVPCICGSYGAQSEFVPNVFQVDPIAYFYEGAFCSKRPVHAPGMWADKVEKMESWHKAADHLEERSILPSKVDWNGADLWTAWEKWFREAAK